MASETLRPNQKNKYRALWEFTHGVTVVDSIPTALQIARSNTCNFKCVYCADHRPGNTLPRNKLEGQTWDNLLALIPKADILAFHGISEFMIDPDFFDLVQRCADAQATLFINTNGSVCTPKYVDLLAAYPGQLNMNFSIDAATPETFKRVRGWNFFRVLQNIKTYVERFETRRDKTQLTLSFVITKSNAHEMVPFVFLAKALKVENIHYYRLSEAANQDWRAETLGGGIFDYRQECTSTFVSEYNRAVEATRRVAEMLGVTIQLPEAYTVSAPDEKAVEPVEQTAEAMLQPGAAH